MRVEFRTDELRRLYEEEADYADYGMDVVRSYRKKVVFLLSARSELDLRAMRSLHFEKLKGARDGQHSIRLNNKWRLIVALANDDEGRVIVVIEIVDYH
ncbi:MAG TPA: type II toxin-antitoxin system RelE/ParE family toxin [Actinomycetes bacterium]|nr:type II toxin-antitoxin system RelE/ParE family toxin [Actinomycetes bacterium]